MSFRPPPPVEIRGKDTFPFLYPAHKSETDRSVKNGNEYSVFKIRPLLTSLTLNCDAKEDASLRMRVCLATIFGIVTRIQSGVYENLPFISSSFRNKRDHAKQTYTLVHLIKYQTQFGQTWKNVLNHSQNSKQKYFSKVTMICHFCQCTNEARE